MCRAGRQRPAPAAGQDGGGGDRHGHGKGEPCGSSSMKREGGRGEWLGRQLAEETRGPGGCAWQVRKAGRGATNVLVSGHGSVC